MPLRGVAEEFPGANLIQSTRHYPAFAVLKSKPTSFSRTLLRELLLERIHCLDPNRDAGVDTVLNAWCPVQLPQPTRVVM